MGLMKTSSLLRPTFGVLLAVIACATGGCESDDGGEPAVQIQSGTMISLADGMVQGEVDGGTRRFAGIPFAAPPVAALRWRPPAPVAPWDGVRDATQFGSPCPQLSSLQSIPSENEDCLHLNVWTPEPAPARRLPVMLWFHGGGNETGSTSDPVPLGIGGLLYDGRVLTETRDVIIVTANYRLNVFGFLAHSALAAEDAGYPYTGNQGLLDQRAAMEWVRDNIAVFGGDPDNVTIFGESAGSFDVCFHVVSPGSRGLFHRAISESGGCSTYRPSAAEAEDHADRMIAAVGCAGASDVLGCLRDVPVADLLAASTGFGPVVDGNVMPDQPRALFARGEYAKVPYILGSNADEGTIFFLGVPPVTTEAEYLDELRERYGDDAEAIAAVYPVSNFPTPQDALARVFGDGALVCSTYDSARRAAAGGAEVYLYNFARPLPIPELAPLNLGALHGVEMAYVFGSLPLPTATDRAIADAVQGYWTSLAHVGDPNSGAAVQWPRYDDATDERLNFADDVTVVSGFRRTECEMWWRLYDHAFE